MTPVVATHATSMQLIESVHKMEASVVGDRVQEYMSIEALFVIQSSRNVISIKGKCQANKDFK